MGVDGLVITAEVIFHKLLKLHEYVKASMGAVRIRHSLREFATQPVILWILLGGKPKWLPLNFGFDDVMPLLMRTAPIAN